MNEDINIFPALDPSDLPEILARWDEPHRRWHGRKHLADLLDILVIHPKLDESDREMLRYVALFHDAVYAPLRSDNEEESAKLAARYLAKYPRRDEVISAILATKTHESEHPLAQHFNFLDCAILRDKNLDRLRVYEDGIAFEYREMERETYRLGRACFLRKAAQDYANPKLMLLADEVEHGRGTA